MLQVKTHPLAEVLAKKLSGIETVPKSEQIKMVTRAIKAAMKCYDIQIDNSSKLHTEVLDLIKAYDSCNNEIEYADVLYFVMPQLKRITQIT